MQLDCLTAGSSPSQRSLINTLCQIVSFLAPHSFPLSLDMDPPACVRLCSASYTVLSPSFSFLLSRLLMAGVCQWRAAGSRSYAL